MKQKRIIKISLCVFGFLCVLTLCKVLPTMANSSPSLMTQWGTILRNFASQENKDNDIYARGNTAIVLEKDIEQATQFYQLSGLDAAAARTTATEYMLQREALYQEALRQGYSVSDAEIYDYLDELKTFMDTASNKEDAYALIHGFGSEDDYWNYQFTVYKKNLPIQNMVADLQKQYFSTQSYSNSNSNTIDDWNSYFESYKNTLVNNENFECIQ